MFWENKYIISAQQFFKSILYCIFLSLSSQSHGEDYSLMKHRVFVDALRGGAHDTSGTNSYYFTLQLFALRAQKEGALKGQSKRERLPGELKKFGELQLEALTAWVNATQGVDSTLAVEVEGAEIRKLVLEAMKKWSVKETEVAVMASIDAFEVGKFLYFFGQDTKIGSVAYYPIPETKLQALSRTNVKVSIKDDLGFDAMIKIKYANPREEAPASTPITEGGEKSNP